MPDVSNSLTRAAALTDAQGNLWAANNGYDGGSPFSTTAAAAGGALYQTSITAYSPFTYEFPVANGSYTVTLKFAEISGESTGRRFFHVDLNGARVLSNFDVYATVGGRNIGVDRSFPLTVTGRHVRCTLTAVASSATGSAIQITSHALSVPA
jgi:hypothetical protein